jgi:hypothetical protein
MTVSRAMTPPLYTVTAVLRVTEGAVPAPDALAQGALKSHVVDVTFTRAHLEALLKRHPDEFPDATKDLDGTYEEMREQIGVEISENDMVGEHTEMDPPRSARISISFTGSKPQVAWDVTHELVDLLIDSSLARQRAALLREQVGAEAAVERAEQQADDGAVAGLQGVQNRLETASGRAAGARMVARAAEQNQTLRFELVDPGRVPPKVGRSALVVSFLTTLAILLLAAALLAGAFDPRIIGGGDLRALQIPLLGELPPLPAAPTSAAKPS